MADHNDKTTPLAEKLSNRRVKQPDVVIEEAKRAGILVCSALAMLEMETGIPQRNIFGHDPGAPFPGEKVTPERIKKLLASPYANGVGWTQLTYKPFVEQAEAMGGAHLPRYQMRVGFKVLRENFDRTGSVEQMFASYNGSGPAAVVYGRRAVSLRSKWSAVTSGR